MEGLTAIQIGETITVKWSELVGSKSGNSPIVGYSLHLKADDGFGSTDKLLTETLETSFEVSGLAFGHIYQFYVVARNIYGKGPASELTSGALAGVPEKPEAAEVSQEGT